MTSGCPWRALSFLVALLLTTASFATEPDFKPLKDAKKQSPVAEARVLQASDGIELAYRQYVPRDAKGVLVFLHAGGLHSGVGYQHLAFQLARDSDIAVVTPDLRGHGESGGVIGDAPSRNAFFQDLDTVLDFVDHQFPDLPIFLGAHSSGAALMLNYQDWHKRKNLAGLVFVSPYLGAAAKLDRRSDPAFVQVSRLGMIANKSTLGLACGHCKAVSLNLPHAAKIAFRPLVDDFTVNAARPFSVAKPLLQVRKLRLPFGVWCGGKDEMIQGGKTRRFFKENGREPWLSRNDLLRSESHFSILLKAAPSIGSWINEQISQRPGGPRIF